jgi:hypothetical protein
MKGKFNIIQRTMMLWNDIYPYNAVHVVRIPRYHDKERLIAAIRRQLENHGLTGLILDRGKGSYQYLGGPAHVGLKIIEKKSDTDSALHNEIEEQLNMPFPDDGEMTPFRFFAVHEKESFYLGLVYFHCIAGAESIVLLLKGIVNTYLQRDANSFSHAVDLYPECYGNPLHTPKFLLPGLAALLSFIRDMRRASRPRYRSVNDQYNGLSFFTLGSDDFHALVKTGKVWGVTLNDIFLALILKSLAPLASGRIKASRRRQIAVGSIVNIRKDLGINGLKTFGLFLGSFIVSHHVPEGISIENLAMDICRQTSLIKKQKRYLGTPFELFSAQLLISLFPPDGRKKFYPKYYPLWGGITNMNLNTLWEQKEDENPVDYFRAVSTGPVTPLVLSITTVRDLLNIGVTYKTAVFSQKEVELFIAEFINSIHQLLRDS